MSSKKAKARVAASSSDSDSGPEDRNPPQKKAKTTNKSSGNKASGSNDADGNAMFQLARMRYASVREFRGKVMVDIREYYESDGDLKPGKKGICLNVEQWNALKGHIESIDEAIKRY